MNVYIALKVIHVISSTVLFGTGLGIAFFKWIVDRSGNVSAIRVVSGRVVLADWLFTTPAILVQAVTGIALARLAGFPLRSGWLAAAIALYLLAGACWLPVVWLQMRMRDLASQADRNGAALGDAYWRYARLWFRLGVPAFVSLLVVFWLMVAKPF
ncbi:DUF2269 domain-containing protein [Rudaea sp.]|uniref:DUF2269 family protein n=1 Tax=Rudaea sp. TaxID=2136325 RepID=UPI002ED28E6F